MTDYTLDDRFAENRAAWTDYWRSFTIERFGAVLAVIALLVAVTGYINQHGGLLNLTNILGDFYANVSSELISIVITVLVVDRLNRAREKRDNEALQSRLDEQELTRLKALMRSDETVVTRIAIAELRAKGWLEDGSLKKAIVEGANLGGANLIEANLSGTDFRKANLLGADLRRVNHSEAILEGANLSGADLRRANLSRAVLNEANLSGADLRRTNLSSAFLIDTNLKGTALMRANLTGADLMLANLSGAALMLANLSNTSLEIANLEHANMYFVKCNEETILPDGTRWTSDVDWTQYGAVIIEDWDDWQAYREEQGLDKQSE